MPIPNERRSTPLALGLLLSLVLGITSACGPLSSSSTGAGQSEVPKESAEAARVLIDLGTRRETRPVEAFYPSPMYDVDRS